MNYKYIIIVFSILLFMFSCNKKLERDYYDTGEVMKEYPLNKQRNINGILKEFRKDGSFRARLVRHSAWLCRVLNLRQALLVRNTTNLLP